MMAADPRGACCPATNVAQHQGVYKARFLKKPRLVKSDVGWAERLAITQRAGRAPDPARSERAHAGSLGATGLS